MCIHERHKIKPEEVFDDAEGRCFIDTEVVLDPYADDSGSDVVRPIAPIFPSEKCCDNCSERRENSILKCEKAYWKTMHQKAVERESKLKQEKADLEAKLRLREKQLYGRKSEG